LTREFIIAWLNAVPTFAAPFLLAVVGLIITEKAGTINLGAEGIMAIGALTGVIAMVDGLPWWLALIIAALAAGALTLLYITLAIVLKLDQVLSGLVVFATGVGISGYVGISYTNLPIVGIPAALASNFLGMILQDPLTWFAFLSAPLAWWVLYQTDIGLRIRAAGDNAPAADAIGVHVTLVRIVTTFIGGLFLGLAGAHLSLVGSHLWVDGMVAGRGWIAIVLVVFARWNPLRAIGAALLFGASQAIIPRLQAIGAEVPTYLLLMLPYGATILVYLALSRQALNRDTVPSDLGRPYIREERR
jgi:general nucleoside transport system permease protein